MNENARIAVVGVTGVVGREVVGALLEAGVPPDNVTALGTDRSEGEEIEYGSETLEIERAAPEAFRGHRAVVLAVPEQAARVWGAAAPAARARGGGVSPAVRGGGGGAP